MICGTCSEYRLTLSIIKYSYCSNGYVGIFLFGLRSRKDNENVYRIRKKKQSMKADIKT